MGINPFAVIIMISFSTSGARLLMTQRKLNKNKMSSLEQFVSFSYSSISSVKVPTILMVLVYFCFFRRWLFKKIYLFVYFMYMSALFARVPAWQKRASERRGPQIPL